MIREWTVKQSVHNQQSIEINKSLVRTICATSQNTSAENLQTEPEDRRSPVHHINYILSKRLFLG